MAMISNITASQLNGAPTQDRRSEMAINSMKEVADYYSALLRCVQAQRSGRDTQSYSVGITSCSADASATTIAINLAIIAARSGHRRVLLVDANTKSPSVAKSLGVAVTVGMTDVLSGSALLGDALQTTTIDGLSLLAVGNRGKQLGTDYDVQQVVDLLDELKSEFEFIVFDLPQADELSECYAFAEVLGGIFLVVEAGRVDGRVARRVKQRLEHGGANLLGAIYTNQN